ncbi:MAG: DUF58 domain-containing protein [Cyclobacteriaceae bacterium]|nr:DUF58 domain-containing protein [Cyclobacteriaceae bacterium]
MQIDFNEIRNYGNLELLAKQLVEGFITGLHKSPYHGFSVEFAEHQLYNTGESTRHIDWKVYAKTDRLYTKRYEEETNLRCQIVIDNSLSMYYPSENKGKIAFSIMAAASLAYLLQRQRDAFGLCVFSDKIDLQSEIKSTSTHLNTVLQALQKLTAQNKPTSETNIASVLHEIAEKNKRRSLVIIFSDMFESTDNLDGIFSALQHLKHNKHEVLLFHVNDKSTELDFDFEDKPHQFIDLESGEKLKIQPAELKTIYQNKVAQFHQELRIRCGQLKIDLIETDIRKGYHQILQSYLIKRRKMR